MYLKNEIYYFFERFRTILKIDSEEPYIKSSLLYYQTIIDYYKITTKVLLDQLITMSANPDKLHINIAVRILYMRNKQKKDKNIVAALKEYS